MNEQEKQECAIALLESNVMAITINNLAKNIVDIRHDLNAHILDVLKDSINGSLAGVYLTDPSTSSKVGWYLAQTVLKVGLNIVTMGLGGIVLDSFHGLLGTHGASIFELNKKKVKLDEGGVVYVRSDTDWGRTATGKEIGLQIVSDLGDMVFGDSVSSAKTNYLHAMKVSVGLESEKLKKLENTCAVATLVMPVALIEREIEFIRNATISIAAETIGREVEKSRKEFYAFDQNIIDAVNRDLASFGITGYISHLMRLMTDLPRPNKDNIMDILLAETLCDNAGIVLKNTRPMSKGMWDYMSGRNLIATVNNSDITSALSKYEGVSNEMLEYDFKVSRESMLTQFIKSSKYNKALNKQKSWKMSVCAQKYRKFGVTSKKKFGVSSTLGTLIRCQYFVDEQVQRNESAIKTLKENISWKSYLTKLRVLDSQENIKVLNDLKLISSP
ncbi:hypothetical protein [Photobacterium lipolyticum]|uniref:Uncharacterized protein n=1 Tax=Photobacterium lipolyticum TaxID=266810 RepID=A0A2T3MUT0_9GAMM|nr:hypothetical protein [Photobacterium lipolyticum]PSW03701.1 hypothetical protein C9I89_16330 [Photobacterium lipolyticum]